MSVSSRISPHAFAMRDVFRGLGLKSWTKSTDLNNRQFRTMANMVWSERDEIVRGGSSGAAAKLKNLAGMSENFTNENIACILREERTAAKFALPTDAEIEQKVKGIKRALGKAKDIDEIWKIFNQIILKETNLGSGGEVCEINHLDEIRTRDRSGLKGTSRYTDWMLPKGEKAQIIYIYNVVLELVNAHEERQREQGSNKKAQECTYDAILEYLKFWLIHDREKWPQYGLTKQILSEALDKGLLMRLDKLKSSPLSSILIETVKRKFCVTNRLVDDYCWEAFDRYLDANKIVDKTAIQDLQKTCEAVMGNIKPIVNEALRKIYKNGERIEASRKFLGECGMKELSAIINDSDRSFSIFEETVSNFGEALQDIELDKRRLGLEAEKGTPKKFKPNFYEIVAAANRKPLALALANKQEGEIVPKENEPLFELNFEISLKLLKEVSPSLSNAMEIKIGQREKERSDRQAKLLHELSDVMSDVSMPIEKRQDCAVNILQNIFRSNGETINVSLFRMDPAKPNEMYIASTTIKDPRVKADRIDISATPTKISAYVAYLRDNVYMAKREVSVGGTKLSHDQLMALEKKFPELYGELAKIIRREKGSETFMCVPIISVKDLYGLMSVRAARLPKGDMDILLTSSGLMKVAITSDIQSKELKKALEERIKLLEKLETQARTDELTKVLNRVALEETLTPAIDRAYKNPEDDCSVVMIDIDDFKKINDVYGHKNGDRVLQAVAKLINEEMKGNLLRYGGEEFLGWLPHRKKKDANALCEEIREKVSEKINVTICMGISSVREDYDPKNPDKLLDKADIALYGAKFIIGKGRDRPKNACWEYNDEVARQVAEMRKTKAEALEKAEELLRQANAALSKGAIETVAKLLGEIDQTLHRLSRV